MTQYRRIVKVFLGSPNDVSAERGKFKDILSRVNQVKANMMGFHFDSLMWEDIRPMDGRPQEIINKNLVDESDICVFVLWKRWGSATGEYTSGFEEEYELANRLNKEKRKPNICIFFRKMDIEAMDDQDEQFNRVKSFKNKIKAENSYTYNYYQDVTDWEHKLLETLCQWLDNNIKRPSVARKSTPILLKTKLPKSDEFVHSKGLVQPKWKIVDTPDTKSGSIRELFNPGFKGSSVIKLLCCNDGMTLWSLIRRGDREGIGHNGAQTCLFESSTGGIAWSEAKYITLSKAQSNVDNGTLIWDIAVAPDDPNIIAAVCSDISIDPLAQEIWISRDKGNEWHNTKWNPFIGATKQSVISSIDISPYFDDRLVIVGSRDGVGDNRSPLQIMTFSSFGKWSVQNDKCGILDNSDAPLGDVMAARFSPNFAADKTVVVLYVTDTQNHSGTWLCCGYFDQGSREIHWQHLDHHIEMKHSSSKQGDSPNVNEIISASIELPMDFLGTKENEHCVFVHTDAVNRTADGLPNRGIYRVQGQSITTLMDNSLTFGLIENEIMSRRVSSIAYLGTSKKGKLLVGEVLGNTKTCFVQTWFTDCPISESTIWYPALKRLTGAGNGCSLKPDNSYGYGNAIVAWSLDGSIAYACSNSASISAFKLPEMDNKNAIIPRLEWPSGLFNCIACDESGLSISRNNGETWNQLSLINTKILKLTDVAPAVDGTTLYLSSIYEDVNKRYVSVWRTTTNPNVAAPLPAIPPIGYLWERVMFHAYENAEVLQYDLPALPVLKVIQSQYDKKDGEIIGCALQYTDEMFWSPDYGDYWALIDLRQVIQDFAFGSSTDLYCLSPDGSVQRLPYTGTNWSIQLSPVDTQLGASNSINAYAEHVIVTASRRGGAYLSAISIDKGKSWIQIPGKTPDIGNLHVVKDENFKDTQILYIADDAYSGTIYRQRINHVLRLEEAEIVGKIMKRKFGGCYGLAIVASAKKQPILYALVRLKEDNTFIRKCVIFKSVNPNISNSTWEIIGDSLEDDRNDHKFTLGPEALKICSQYSFTSSPTLYAIDNNFYANNHNTQIGLKGMSIAKSQGMLWMITDFNINKVGNRWFIFAMIGRLKLTLRSLLTR